MMADGLLGKCKQCARKDVRENRIKRRDYYNEYDSARAKKGYKTRKKWAIDHKDVLKVNRTLRKAVYDGLVIRLPCEVCGEKNSVGHHENYSKPLDVVWLCASHHRSRHFELRSSGIDIYKTF